eukprot:TRINITY_DN9151_c0_g1_i1.p3 TRINITY_DN9151_c0_g1~~TRINITY_DN9151_c0_g1_i1.p3  ORF type:complete len:139 (-),score=26.16 TRINITY_DN9151_c0_g1_i1:10-426(-)
MVEYVKSHAQNGVHSLLLVLHGQAPRFNGPMKKMIRLYLAFINSPEFWSHIALVFTNCTTAVTINRETRRTCFVAKMQELFKEAYPSAVVLPSIPCFFIDSKCIEANDPATVGELAACLLYTSPSPRDQRGSRMPSSA